MKSLWNVLTFQRMIAPILLQIFFWAGVGGSLYGAYVLFRLGNWAWPFPFLLGPLLTRILVESWILAFRSYDRLSEISRAIQKDAN